MIDSGLDSGRKGGTVSLLGRLVKYEVKRTVKGDWDIWADYEIEVMDIATGITAKAKHHNDQSSSLKDALKDVVEQLIHGGYLHSLDVELLAKAFVDCVEEPSTCTQGGTVPIVVSDPSAFLPAKTPPTSTFQLSPALLHGNTLIENLSLYVTTAALGIGTFIVIVFIISCLYKRWRAYIHGLLPGEMRDRLQGLQSEETIEPQFRHHTLDGGICFLGDPWQEVVTSAGKVISWADIGIEIDIQPGTVPEGRPIVVTVRPCLSGPFELPEDYELASPVYTISPGVEFSKDVKLFMAHFADLQSGNDCKNMTFLTTGSSSFPGDSHPYRLMVQENGVFQVGSSVGKISLRHFCKKAIGRKRKQDGKEEQENAKRSKISFSREQEPKLDDKEQGSAEHTVARNLYLVQLYQNTGETDLDDNNVAAVTVSLHHPLFAENFKRCLEKDYPPFHFVVSGKAVHFSSCKASVKFPTDVEGWKILPDIQPCEILKEEVDLPILFPEQDYFHTLIYPPKLLLTISPPAAKVGLPYSSHCQISIDGFIEEVQFTLRLRPPSPLCLLNHPNLLPSKADSETKHPSLDHLRPSMQDLIAFPAINGTFNIPKRISTSYKQFGIVLLEDDEGTLVNGIAHKHFNNPEEINIEILTQWLSGKGRKPVTWQTIINTLEEIGLKTMAKDIAIGLGLASKQTGRSTTRLHLIFSSLYAKVRSLW